MNRNKFITNGWEYQIYHWSVYKCDYISDRWSEWGWLSEKQLDTLN
ncbi:MAG: hypothetical protein ACIWVG_04520 [Gloeotrichia echinulata HAB0833]